MRRFIPVAQPSLSPLELKYVTQAVKSTWISSTGSFIDEFETQFAKTVGSRFAISTSNGTTALHLALLALGVGASDEVIVPALTFVASANAVRYTGAKVVFVDVLPGTWNIDPDKIKLKINSRTRALMPVHLYGYPAAMAEIMKLANKHRLYVIEDAAEAHGAKVNDKIVGTFGDVGCFSFYGNKIITTGEGGMITTDNKRLAEKVRLLKNHGMSPTKRYWHQVIGYNHRLTNLQAAVGLAQLKQFAKFLKIRNQIALWYRSSLSKIPAVVLPPEDTNIYTGVNWLFTFLIKPTGRKTRDGLIKFLEKHGIDSRPTFYPIPEFPMYKTREKFPVSEQIAKTGITLPTYVGLSQTDVAHICQTVATYFQQ